MYLVKPTKIFCVQFENWQGPTVLYHLLPIIIYKNILAHILWMSNTDVVCVIVITIPLGALQLFAIGHCVGITIYPPARRLTSPK